MKRHLLFLSFIVSIIIIYSSCKKEKLPDPCLGQEEVSADFVIEEMLDGAEVGSFATRIIKYIEADTIIAGNQVRFTARQDMDEYFWIVGTDTTKKIKSKSFVLRFSDATKLDVTLIGKRAVKKECFPDDDGIDTVIKRMVVLPHPIFGMREATNKDCPFLGSYEGYHEDEPNKIFTFTISINPPTSYINIRHFAFYNIPEGCLNDLVNTYLGYKVMHIGSVYRGGKECSRGVRGWASLSNNNQDLKFEYDRCIADAGPCPLNETKQRVFRGKRK